MKVLTGSIALLVLLAASPVLSQEEPEATDKDAAATVETAEEGTVDQDDDEVLLEETDDSPSLIDQCRDEARRQAVIAVPPARKYPFIEWHGYFRVRGRMFTDVDLNTYAAVGPDTYVGTSQFMPPLRKNAANDVGTFSEKIDAEDENTLGTANMRFRLSPIIRISDTLRIKTRIDILDNIVLGSTPEYLDQQVRPRMPIDTLTGTQIPPTAGVNSFQDSITVKSAFLEWDLTFDSNPTPDSFSLGTLTLGRFAYDWGLGMVWSAGDFDRYDTTLTTMQRLRALDADGANYVDRITWKRQFDGFKLMAGYGMLSSGPTAYVMHDESLRPYDIEEDDDIRQFELAIYSRPEGRNEFIKRRKDLYTGKPMLDWGLYVTYRNQKSATYLCDSSSPAGSDLNCEATEVDLKGENQGVDDYVDSYNDLLLVKRDAWVVTPDLWARLDWRPDPKTRIYLGFEAAMTLGRIGNLPNSEVKQSALTWDDIQSGTELDLLTYGMALESNFTIGAVSFGLDWGMASGDTGETAVFSNPGMKSSCAGNPWGCDSTLSKFAFNRNYNVDLLMYKEVIGTVTNATYFRPHFDFDVIPTEDNALGGAIQALYSMTMEPGGYPGDSRNLGLEFDFHAFYEEAGRFMVTAGFGLFFPFAALDRPEDFMEMGLKYHDANWAWTLQGNMFLVF